MNSARAGELLTKETVHPATIDDLLLHYFPEWVMWEPETIESAIRSLSKQGYVPFLVMHKVSAVQTMHNNEGPWEDWEVFNWLSQPFNDELTNFQYAKKPSLPELYITIDSMKLIRKRAFGDEVVRFIAAACLDSGILYTPPPLEFVQNTLDIVKYRCTKCGNIDILDNNECDNCGAPEAALVKEPKYYDWKDVKQRWDVLKTMPLEDLPLQETVEDIHIAKIANALLLMKERRDQYEKEKQYAQ